VDVELRHLRALVAVAEELNFTRAAERLHLSQQALSAQIRQLEQRVGTRLVERDTRRVELTPAGARLREQAGPVLARAERAVSAARAARPKLALGLRMPQTLALAGPALEQFAERRPDVDLGITFGDLLDPSAGLRSGEADVAIVAGPFESAGLEARPLFSEERGLALSAEHPLARKPAVTLAEYLDEPIVDVPTRDETWRDYWYANSHRLGKAPLVGATAHSMEGMLEAVRAGLGVALTIEAVVDALGPSSAIAFRPIAGLEPVEFRVCWHSDDDRAEVSDFVEAVWPPARPQRIDRRPTGPQPLNLVRALP
jgi:DNA-binding transcriptional LysR family regulator